VYNPSNEVAEVEVEVRLVDPDANGVPEPFELTIAPHRYQIVDLSEPDLEVTETTPRRVPDDVEHSIIVRSLNGVPIAAEKVLIRSEPQANLGVSATLGMPIGAPTWFIAAGGVSSDRTETIHVFNPSTEHAVRFSVHALDNGKRLEIQSLQDREIAPGAQFGVRIDDHVDLEDLPLVITADGPIAVERGLFRIGGRGMSLSMGIPLDQDTIVFDPLET
jgi:hypothetical protein